MATAVLRFVRGVDLSGTRFDDDAHPFPATIDQLLNARWLRLNETNLESIPTAVNRLSKLEHLYLEGNRLLCIPPSIRNLTSLRAFRASSNDLSHDDICGDLFNLPELLLVDLSHNSMAALPQNVAAATGLLALSVGHNRLADFDPATLQACTRIEYLDLSANSLILIPPQLRYVAGLRTLMISDNDLDPEDPLLSIYSLTELERLEMAGTKRTDLPDAIVRLRRLRDLDLSRNPLPQLPVPLLSLTSLERLNLSDCALRELPAELAGLARLQFLNLSRNRLTALPDEICELRSLLRLYVNSNCLTHLPANIGALSRLEQLLVANNELGAVPESLGHCHALRRLDVHGNRLPTLPAAVFEISGIRVDFSRNPGFVRPVRRDDVTDASVSLASLSLNDPRNGTRPQGRAGQRGSLRLSSGTPTRRVEIRDDASAQQVVSGLNRIAAEAAREPPTRDGQMHQALEQVDVREHKPKSYQKRSGHPRIDYSELYADEVGLEEGLTVFRLEHFLPSPVPPAEVGQFYEADTYIVLRTEQVGDDLRHTIFFWLGALSSLDKKASAAMQAVALRDHLQAVGATKREEQGDESMEFLALFQNSIVIIQGGSGSGFYDKPVEEGEVRLYYLEDRGSLRAHAMACTAAALHERHAFMLQDRELLFVWCGPATSVLLRQKARLFAEKSASLAHLSLIDAVPGKEPARFWELLGGGPPSRPGSAFVEPLQRAKLHAVRLGEGFLEMPQVVSAGSRLERGLLESAGVYILDDYADLWVWVGRRSSRLVRAAALKMCANLRSMLPRPPYAATLRVTEGNEPLVFRSKFDRWDSGLRTDHRTAELAALDDARGSASSPAAAAPPRINVNDMFLPPPQPVVDEQRQQELEEQAYNRIETINVFVVENLRSQRLQAEQIGQFYAGDCYLIYVEQWRHVERSSEEELEARAFFWQGRDAPLYLWPFFCTRMLGEFEREVKRKLGVPLVLNREFQQRESEEFMMLFRHRMIVHQGRRCMSVPLAPRFFWCHVYKPSVFTRTLQVANDSKLLNSEDCFIFVVPFDANNGVVYIWIGANADPNDALAAQTVARDHLRGGYTEQTVSQGREPRHFFWANLDEAAAKPDLPGLSRARLFLCSHREGFFQALECRPSFCQDQLDEWTTAILDSGQDVFVWHGRRSSPVTNRLALRAATEYAQQLPTERQSAKVVVVEAGREPWSFTRAFFGWKAWKSSLFKSLLPRPSYLGQLKPQLSPPESKAE